MDRDWLYLALLIQKELEDCIRPKMKTGWKRLRSKDCSDCSTADASGTFFPDYVVTSTKNTTRENTGFSKKNSDVHRYYASIAGRTAVTMLPQRSLDSVANV